MKILKNLLLQLSPNLPNAATTFCPMELATYNLLMDSFLLQKHKLPWPVAWDKIFGREAPLIIEIGFGGGHFLIDLAQKRPFANILGVEISLPAIDRGERKIRNASLNNVRLLQVNARYLLQALCTPQSVAEVYINFPDPWPKANHHHRRLISVDFLHLLATRMVKGGQLEIATDHAAYAEAITTAVEATPYFQSCLPSTFVTEDSDRLRTKYEQKGLDEGHTCHYYKWERNNKSAPNSFPVPQELPMPHVVLQTPLDLDTIQEKYTPWHVSSDDTHVGFMELFRAHGGEMLFVETYLREEPLSQRLGLLLRRRESGDYVISLHELGFPRPTAGVHLAIGQLAHWLLGLHEDGAILHHNLQSGAF
ncbi:MAG: tRNA (guanosine(46)-N7)-methyltransferase TrmB [Chloroflexi bacterium]|nr:tRNA (guanosine(46)-N7)-methyltransferase TrmB [Chloroflexota bacterium]